MQLVVKSYQSLWCGIKKIAPSAILLRAPNGVESYYESGGGDLDILIDTCSLSAVVNYLKSKGFVEEYSPQSFRRTFRLRDLSHSEPYTVDLYTGQQWGLGFRLEGHQLAEQAIANFMRAVFDLKGRQYFESRHPDGISVLWAITMNSWDRIVVDRLWRYSLMRLLSLYMIITKRVRPEWGSIIKSVWLRFRYKIRRIIYKQGLEIALIGVDGSGKSSLSEKLKDLPLPLKSIYMGSSGYRTSVMKAIENNRRFKKLHFIGYHLEMMVRKLEGAILSRRGWIIVYDRHPVEQFRLDGGFKKWLNNAIAVLYNWKIDGTYWLTGDLDEIYKRKLEHPVEVLKTMEHTLEEKLKKFSVSFKKLDSTQYDIDQLYAIVGRDIISLYQKHLTKYVN